MLLYKPVGPPWTASTEAASTEAAASSRSVTPSCFWALLGVHPASHGVMILDHIQVHPSGACMIPPTFLCTLDDEYSSVSRGLFFLTEQLHLHEFKRMKYNVKRFCPFTFFQNECSRSIYRLYKCRLQSQFVKRGVTWTSPSDLTYI